MAGIFPNMESVGPKNFNVGESIKLHADSMAPAVLASGQEIFHYDEDRPITIRERAALQSFPYSYEFLGTLTEQKRQIGNAVPVELSRAIARSLRESLRYGYVEEMEAMAAAESDDEEDEDEDEEELEDAADAVHRVEPSTEGGEAKVFDKETKNGMEEGCDEATEDHEPAVCDPGEMVEMMAAV